MIGNKYLLSVCLVSSMAIAFLVTNFFWVVTATYALPVADFGEKAVLVGTEAVSKILEENGLHAYLDGLSWFFVLLTACCFIACVVMDRKLGRHPLIWAFIVSVVGALSYFLLSVGIYEYDNLNGESHVVYGLEAIKQSGYMWSALSAASMAVLFFVSGIISTAIVHVILRKQK